MICRICDENPCICSSTAPGSTIDHIRSTYIAQPYGLTLDEFGADLYDAIKAASGRQQCLANAEMYRHKGLIGKAEKETLKATNLYKEVKRIVTRETVQPNDVRQLLSMYAL